MLLKLKTLSATQILNLELVLLKQVQQLPRLALALLAGSKHQLLLQLTPMGQFNQFGLAKLLHQKKLTKLTIDHLINKISKIRRLSQIETAFFYLSACGLLT